MGSRERIKTIVGGGAADRCGFWLGMPHPTTWPIYLRYFDAESEEQVRRMLGDDMRWMWGEAAYRHPLGKEVFHSRIAAEPPFADTTDPAEIDSVEWPNPDDMDFTALVEALRNAGDVYRASGMWSAFFHIIAEYFGMENYFIKMHTNPAVVDAVTERVCEFFLEANRRFFDAAKDEVDAFFMGNDYGTQLDLLISPQLMDRFVMPYTRELTGDAKRRGYQVLHHCCGAVHKAIPRLIDAGIDGLHPLQALAHDMDADTLARDFGGKMAFIGGIDTQHLLVHGTPDQVKDEVRRVKRALGPRLVVSPSHEALLPNVPPENVAAMSEAARED